MRITSVRIKNFRTITNEQTLRLRDGLTLIGPNNAGKTNALLGLYFFFTGHENKYGYLPERDLPFSSKNIQTSLTCHFEANEFDDADVLEKLKKLRGMLRGVKDEADKNEFSINVYFNRSLPVYQIYPGAKKAEGKSPQYSTLQKAIVTSVLDSFQCYYIPSNKSIAQLYDEFVSPFVKKKVAEALKPHDAVIRKSISALTDSMDSVLKASGLDVQVNLEYPKNALEHLISGFDVMVKDVTKSSIFSKGMGVQSAVLLSSFSWITSQHPDKRVLWLIEEPETFMHPHLAYQSSKILDDLAGKSTVVKTTHSLSFMPKSVSGIQGVVVAPKSGGTQLRPYSSMKEATDDIRISLGVKFSDFFGLTDINLFVEGETDIAYLSEMAGHYQDAYDVRCMLASEVLQYREFGGVTGLTGFLKSNYELIRKEVVVVSLFDGDSAGKKAVGELSGYFGTKGGFNSNNDFVIIPKGFAIEGLFPDEWIISAHLEFGVWFKSFVVDAAGAVDSFEVRDESKKTFMRHMQKMVAEATDYFFLEKFEPVIESIEHALLLRVEKMFGVEGSYKDWFKQG